MPPETMDEGEDPSGFLLPHPLNFSHLVSVLFCNNKQSEGQMPALNANAAKTNETHAKDCTKRGPSLYAVQKTVQNLRNLYSFEQASF